MKRNRNSANLGELGEQEFAHMCVKAGLIPNKSEIDRTGWDFIVELPFDTSQSDYDQRTPIKTVFQIKTQWADNDQIEFRLSSLEHIAKDAHPAFICILKYDQDENVTEALIIHIIGDFLELILKKLREERAINNKKINKKKFKISAKKYGTCFLWNKDQLRNVLETAIKTPINKYILFKQK